MKRMRSASAIDCCPVCGDPVGRISALSPQGHAPKFCHLVETAFQELLCCRSFSHQISSPTTSVTDTAASK